MLGYRKSTQDESTYWMKNIFVPQSKSHNLKIYGKRYLLREAHNIQSLTHLYSGLTTDGLHEVALFYVGGLKTIKFQKLEQCKKLPKRREINMVQLVHKVNNLEWIPNWSL